MATRVEEIADYLLSVGIGNTEAAWLNEVLKTIARRWPDVTEAELNAAFLLVTINTALHALDAAGIAAQAPALSGAAQA